MVLTYQDTAPGVQVKDIQWDTIKHTLTIRERRIALTKTEYLLLLPLKRGLPVTYSDMALDAYNCPVDEKVLIMIDKHIDRIRAKLRGTGIYIYCVLHYGYILFPESFPPAPPEMY